MLIVDRREEEPHCFLIIIFLLHTVRKFELFFGILENKDKILLSNSKSNEYKKPNLVSTLFLRNNYE